MNIRFFSPLVFPDYYPDLEEVQREEYLNHGYHPGFYYQILALESNNDFSLTVLKARKMLGLPQEGLDPEDYIPTFHLYDCFSYKMETDDQYMETSLEHLKLWTKVTSLFLRKFNLEDMVSDSILDIVYANMAIIPSDKIFSGGFYKDDDEHESYPQYFSITINEPVTQSELIIYIKKNWHIMIKEIDKLSSPKNLHVSERDYRVIELKDKEDKTFLDIANKIKDEFNLDDIDAKINPDSMKMAYFRGKDKIMSTSRSRKSNKK